MKKRFGILFFTVLLLSAIFMVSAAAGDKTVVYIKDGGDGDGSSASSAFNTLTKCYDALDLSKDCTIVVCGPYTQSTNWVYHDKSGYSGSVTFTSVYGGTDYRKSYGACYKVKEYRFSCFGDTRFENLNFVALGKKYMIVGQHNPVTIGEGVTISGADLTGGNVATAFSVVGGYLKGFNNPPATSDKDINITVLSGDKLYIIPFAHSLAGSYTGTANVHIGGSAKVGVLHGSSTYGDGSTLGNVKMTIDGSASIKNFYGCTSDVTVGSYEINWTSGTIESFEWVCSNTPGKTLTVTGSRTLGASALVQKNANYEAIAANFDKVNSVKGEYDDDILENATVVYVKNDGTGNGASPEKATASLADAYAALDLSKDCTIVVCGRFNIDATFNYGKDYTGSVTFTSLYDGKDYREDGAALSLGAVRFVLYGKTAFDNVKIETKGAYFIVVAQHNPFTIGEGVNMLCNTRMTGATTTTSFTIIAGYEKGQGTAKGESNKDTNVTVLSGEKIYIVAFSRNVSGSYTGTANIHVGGTAKVSVVNGSAAYPDDIIVGDVKLTLDGDASITNFYGCTQITTASSYEVIWKSGTIENFYWLCPSTPEAKLTVNGTKILRASTEVAASEKYATVAPEFDYAIGLDDEIESKEIMASVKPKNAYAAARGLFMLNLAQGYDTTGKNFGLSDGLNRTAAIVQVIRFLGVEDVVKSGSYSHPFTDVDDWAKNYVGYAYENKITSGISATKFGAKDPVTEAQFLTLMLRAIGYSDAAGDFTWSNPFALAKRIGMTYTETPSAKFLRGEAFTTCWQALFAERKDGRQVCAALEEIGVFEADDLARASTEAKIATEPKKKDDKNTPKLDGYNVISVEDYKDKTFLGFISQFVGFFSGYEFATQGGKLLVAMPDEWFELCNGPYANPNPHNKHEDKLLLNEETGIYEIWNDDDFSIDILNQYILRDMYAEYGTFATEKITDGWVNYDVWDMGGGHRQYGAYGLMKKYGYLAHFAGNTEFGNLYNVNGEPYIANETLGISAAGMPNVAAEMAEIFGGVTSDRDPTEWLRFITAMMSMSYFEDDVKTLIREAQKILPEDSHPYRVIDRMFELYATYPDNWRTACVIAEEENFRNHYDLNVVRGETGINCSFMVLGLLYGDGDYYETCKIISLAGHGGDSTTPGPLSIIGIITGWKDLDEEVKKVINEKIWQDGKGVLVNLPIASMAEGYHMYCGGLPERITLAELLDLYQANFENILKENGGFKRDGYYYIPKSDFIGVNALLAEDFESGSLDGYKTLGSASTTDAAYSGKVSAKVSGNDKSDSEIYAVVDGLTVGKTYRASAFIGTSASTAATLFARDSAKKNVVYADIYDQSAFVKRVIEFTATATTMEIGISLPKGTASHRYAIMDELCVYEAEVKSAGTASILDAAANNLYDGKLRVTVNANDTKENYLVLTFANTNGKTLNSKVTVNGTEYAGVPFYKTGTTAKEAANTVYIPVLAKGESNFTVESTFDGKLSVYSAKLVEKMY